MCEYVLCKCMWEDESSVHAVNRKPNLMPGAHLPNICVNVNSNCVCMCACVCVCMCAYVCVCMCV